MLFLKKAENPQKSMKRHKKQIRGFPDEPASQDPLPHKTPQFPPAVLQPRNQLFSNSLKWMVYGRHLDRLQYHLDILKV